MIPYDLPYDIETYDMKYDIAYLGPGSHWPCPWCAHRACLMILGPAGWAVLHCVSPEALFLSLTYEAATNLSGDSLVRKKIGICDPVASWMTRWHCVASGLSGRVDGLPATQAACGPVAARNPPAALGE